MKNKKSPIVKGIIYFLFVVSISNCDVSNDISETENGDTGFEIPPPKNPATEDTNTDLFVDEKCNRMYWIFKCALEFKISQSHSEECQNNIETTHPNDEQIMEKIEARSKNNINIIKQTWSNYFNQNCKDVLSVESHLKELD